MVETGVVSVEGCRGSLEDGVVVFIADCEVVPAELAEADVTGKSTVTTARVGLLALIRSVLAFSTSA